MIHSAEDENAGLDYFRRYLPDIVITGSNLPENDGVLILDHISAIKPDTRVILSTTRCSGHILDKIARSGVAVELVPKPVDFEILFASITRCMAAISRGL